MIPKTGTPFFGLMRLPSRMLKHEHRIDRLSVTGFAQLARHIWIAQQARDAGERLQMIGASRLRREQQENEIDRLAIQRLELDRPVEPSKETEQLSELGQLSVRDGDAVANTSRS